MNFLPVFLDLKGRPCAVIGGGEVAARKVALLLSAGGRVVVTAPQLCAALDALARRGEIVWCAEAYSAAALDDAVLVIAATNDRAVNAEVSCDAQTRKLPVNVVDDPDLCSFIMPAIIDRSPVIVAVSTGGASPVLTRRLRAEIEALIPAAYGKLAALAERWRERVKAALPADRRRLFWERVLHGPVATLTLSGREAEAESRLAAALAETHGDIAETRAETRADAHGDTDAATNGEVIFVGCGPGDPDLLTLAALRALQQADLAFHDERVPPAILDRIRRDAEIIAVGAPLGADTDVGYAATRLAAIAERACAGRRVLCLVPGEGIADASIAALARALDKAGIPCTIIPGVAKSASGGRRGGQ